MNHQVIDFTLKRMSRPSTTGCTVFRTIYCEPRELTLNQTANVALTSFGEGVNYEPMEKT